MKQVPITTAEHEQAARDYRKAALHCAKMRRDDIANHYLCMARTYDPPADSCRTADFEVVVDFS